MPCRSFRPQVLVKKIDSTPEAGLDAKRTPRRSNASLTRCGGVRAVRHLQADERKSERGGFPRQQIASHAMFQPVAP